MGDDVITTPEEKEKKAKEISQQTGGLEILDEFYDNPFAIPFLVRDTSPQTDSNKETNWGSTYEYYENEESLNNVINEVTKARNSQTEKNASQDPFGVEKSEEQAEEEEDDDDEPVTSKAHEKTSENPFGVEKGEEKTEEDKEKEIDAIKSEMVERFRNIAAFPAFEKWYGGKLENSFNTLASLFLYDGFDIFKNNNENICKCLKYDIIIPIQGLANSVLRNRFTDKLGCALLALYNTLARLYNFITAKPDKRNDIIQTEIDDDRRQSFAKLNETADTFEDLSLENWIKIRDASITSLDESFEYLTKAYDAIEKRIRKLEIESQREGQSSTISKIDISEYTEKNVDIVNKLGENTPIISKGDWQYSKHNILYGENGKLIELREAITNTQKFVSENLKSISKERRSSVWSALVNGNSSTNKDNLDTKKLFFQSLGNVLDDSNAKLTEYRSDDFWKEAKAKTNINDQSLIPFVIRMDNIVFPILNEIYLLYKNGTITSDQMKEGEPSLIDLMKTFLTYLHSPEAVGLDSKMFKDKTKMSKTDLEAYSYASQYAKNTQLIQERHSKEELIDLLSIQYILADIEGINLEAKLVKQKSSPKGSFNREETFENFNEQFSDSGSKFDRDNEGPTEEAEESIDAGTFERYRTMLRVIGYMTLKYNNLNTYVYKYEEGAYSLKYLKRLKSATDNRGRNSNMATILEHVHSFIKYLDKSPNTKLNGYEKNYIACLKKYTHPKTPPPDYDTKLENLLNNIGGTDLFRNSDDSNFMETIKNDLRT